MEKRVYFPGYHVALNKRNLNNFKQESASNDNRKQNFEKNKICYKRASTPAGEVDTNYSLTDENIIASLDNTDLISKSVATTNLTYADKIKIITKERLINSISKIESKKNTKIYSSKQPEPKIGWMALTGFICSILGLSGCFVIFPLLLGVAGIIFSAIALKKENQYKLDDGFATTGLIIGILDVCIFIIIFAIIMIALM